ncbi:MAG TPA: tetratricopeptide repeat protein [Terriglobales bacterium]|nr:tetratricopeptide repeat protein [Terriglobales bacterium]
MEEFSRGRSDRNPSDPGEGGAAIRTPRKGDSSSPGSVPSSDSPTIIDHPAPGSDPSDSPTIIEIPGRASSDPSDSPTLVDHSSTLGPDSPTMVGGTPWPVSPSPTPRAPRTQAGSSMLQPGQVLGQRYEILQILGEGGMGAVYKARDKELNRMVALKVIRPELAGSQAIIDRFKQELLLATRVTHKNVIRIYDLSEAEGMKFITMEFVEGEDLRSLMQQKKKLAPEEAVEIMLQVCRALEAAHSVGIIHRDLKPQNIMRDTGGRILVMDFGLARTLEGDGMTQTGALVGTMDYMSPEQALGKDLDQRSDLFTLGLIFYELLTGKMPYKADSVVASLLKRTQERAAPVSSHDASIPRALSDVVSRCMDPDVKLRYESSAQIMADLEAWQGGRAAATLNFHASSKPWGQTIPWHWIGGVAAILVLAIVGFVYRNTLFKTTARIPAGPVVSLAILPFRNASGDPNLDWLGPSIAEMLSTDVGQSSQLRTVSPNVVHQIFSDLRISSTTVLDPPAIRRVADFSSADRVVWGQYARFGDQIRIDATVQDIKNDRSVPLKIDVPNEKEIPGAIDRMAESIRQKLSLSEDVLKELKASSFQPVSQSVAALRAYNLGMGLERSGKNLDAQKQFQDATKQDPSFALAFSRLAQTFSSLGYDAEAEQSAQKAVTLSQDLPEAEKYLISAIRSEVTKNYPEAIKAYENLAKASPGNSDVQSALANLYEQTGDFAKATEYNQKILASNPNDITATLAVAHLALDSGKAQDSLDPLNRALTLSVQLDNQEQKASTLHYMGSAYRMLNKPEEALRNYQEALAIRRQLGQKNGIASSLNGIARMQAVLGKNKDALANFQEALQIRRDIGDKHGLGDTLIDMGNLLDDLGEHDQALKMYKEALQVQRDVGDESMQATCLNNIGAVYFEKGQYEDARAYYQQALELREKSKIPGGIVDSIHNLAQTSVRMGEYDQAVAQYIRALDLHRKTNDVSGAALDSYALGVMFDYQGRFGAAVNSKRDALKTFQDLKDQSATMTEIEGGYGQSLVLAGRGDEAKAPLEDALNLARTQKNDGLVSQTLAFQGDAAYYRGDWKSARALYEQASQAAVRSKEPDKILAAKVNLAQVSLQEGHAQQVIPDLRQLMQQADEQGVQNVSVECQIYLAQAMLQIHDNAHAQQELRRALLRADKIGLKPQSAEANFQLGNALRASGDPEAQQHYRTTLQLLDEMRKDPGAEKILDRVDFKTMYEESTRGSQAKS